MSASDNFKHMKILITGATGLLGKPLMVRLLEEGHEVIAIARKKSSITEVSPKNVFEWNSSKSFPLKALQGVDAVIHLAGDPVAEGRWTKEKKKQIFESRVLGTRSLIDGIVELDEDKRPQVFLSGSAIGIYGDRGDESLTENSSAGSDFLADVCFQWERESERVRSLGLRLVNLRTGVVLSRQGGALPKMPPFVLGSGKQWISWIHIQDWISGVLHALNQESVSGPVNFTAPHPVTNAEFTQEIRKFIPFPVKVGVPEFVMRGMLGEMAAVVLASQRVLPKNLTESGFKFRFNTLSSALEDLYQEQNYLEDEFQMWQFVPHDVEKVFPFFSAAENLEKITPPWIHFKIEKKSTPEVQANTVIDYKLKIHGVPARWQSQILDWKPGEKFVDDQLKGPYTRWHHTHTFKKVMGGTLLGDQVKFRVPGNIFGKVFLSGFIKKDVQKIFAYRRKVIDELFGKPSAS